MTDNELAGNKSALGILFYNLIKEYLEEMFNYEELIGDVMQRRVDPDWFLELPEARELLGLSQRGLFSVSYLGCGIDCLSGTTTIATLAAVEDQEYGRSIKKKMIANWEVDVPAMESPALQFVDMKDARLSNWLDRGEYQSSSAFALALTLPSLMQGWKQSPKTAATKRFNHEDNAY